MASIEKRKNKDGSYSYQVNIRKKEIEIYKTFYTEEDATLYAFYKERLIDNMKNFDVPLKERVTIKHIFEIKINSIPKSEKKAIYDFENSLSYVNSFLENHDKFYTDITFDDWKKFAENLINCDVFRGVKSQKNKKKMSPFTLRKIFANISSSISYAQTQGIEIDNVPLKVLQSYINPMLKKHSELAQR